MDAERKPRTPAEEVLITKHPEKTSASTTTAAHGEPDDEEMKER